MMGFIAFWEEIERERRNLSPRQGGQDRQGNSEQTAFCKSERELSPEPDHGGILIKDSGF